MKALVKARAEPGIWMQDIPEPSVGHNDVLIKVNRSAICGTDMHIYNWDAWAQKTVPVPMAVGHEYSGEIVELGQRGARISTRAIGFPAKATSPVATAAIAAPAAGTCAATPRVWVLTVRAPLPST